MTAVLQATDVLQKDRAMASFDDNTLSYSSSSTDWKAKYMEVADMLAETRAELDDFQHSSKELEEELERELEQTEKAEQDLKVKVARAETERDEWKSKFMSLQTTHNTTTTSLQRELDTLRAEHQKIKIQLRDLEMGNDDLERNERAISSSLADVEGKYGRVLEEKILLEHELLDKANVEEECQRLKDELRDANEEISIMKDQLASVQLRIENSTDAESTAPSSMLSTTTSSEDNLFNVSAPSDLHLSNLSPGDESRAKETPLFATPRAVKSMSIPGTTLPSLLQRSSFQTPRSTYNSPTSSTASSSLARSTIVPSLSTPSRLAPWTPVTRPAASRTASVVGSTSTAGGVPLTTTKSRGVQMVSEMRARVRVLEQKIHTHVPRLRMGSVTGRTAANQVPPPPPKAGPSSITAPAPSTSSLRSTGQEERLNQLKSRRQSIDTEGEHKRAAVPDSTGWVLIMEDSPSPARDKDKERRRTSSPIVPSSFRSPVSALLDSPYSIPKAPSASPPSAMTSGIRRPQSRLSVSTEGRSSVSTNATTSTASSIPTPSSRPSTPTFLPIPTYGGAGIGLKRSTGPGSGAYSHMKRLSIGHKSPANSSPPSQYHAPHANVTMRSISKLTMSSSMSQSRIARPAGGLGTRKGTGDAPVDTLANIAKAREQSRIRPGSTANPFGRH